MQNYEKGEKTESESHFYHISNSLSAPGCLEEALELVDMSVSGKGEELLRPAFGRPIRLLDRTEKPGLGNLVGGRIVTFEWSEGGLGTFGRSLFGSKRDIGLSRRVSVSDGGEGVVAALLPRDTRLGCEYATCPVERFIPLIPRPLPPYKLGVGTGKYAGVDGRDVGVGMELVVAMVLRLAPERRD